MEGVKEKVLFFLRENRGRYLSGQELSEKLGVSRTAVWKAIHSLRKEGYGIDSQARRGYCLGQVPDLLLPGEIRWGLATQGLGHRIFYYPTVTSTNDMAKKLARRGEPEGTLVVAEEQTGGRGRRGRSWSCPWGQGLLFSLILRPPLQPAQTPQLTLMAAVAVAETISRHLGLEARIKWPNDILIGKRKVAGILTELSAEVEQVNFAVIGIGLNVNVQGDLLPCQTRTQATSLQVERGEPLSRVELLQALLLRLEGEYTEFLQEGFAPVRLKWKELALVLGKGVEILTPRETFRGIAVDIDQDGSLLVETDEGIVRRVLAGDVSLREEN